MANRTPSPSKGHMRCMDKVIGAYSDFKAHLLEPLQKVRLSIDLLSAVLKLFCDDRHGSRLSQGIKRLAMFASHGNKQRWLLVPPLLMRCSSHISTRVTTISYPWQLLLKCIQGDKYVEGEQYQIFIKEFKGSVEERQAAEDGELE